MEKIEIQEADTVENTFLKDRTWYLAHTPGENKSNYTIVMYNEQRDFFESIHGVLIDKKEIRGLIELES